MERAFLVTPAAVLAAIAVVGGLASCSLLAPSDEEAMAGLSNTASGDGGDANARETGGGEGGFDGGPESGSTVCPECPRACNQGKCSACYLNGAPCATATECCGGVCNAQKTCGAMAGACTAHNETCTSTTDSCCPGETCSAERGSRCDVCHNDGDNCKADTDCCSASCGPASKCVACLSKGTTGCTRDRQCCSGSCNAGTCG
jgi:hypothetical protein